MDQGDLVCIGARNLHGSDQYTQYSRGCFAVSARACRWQLQIASGCHFSLGLKNVKVDTVCPGDSRYEYSVDLREVYIEMRYEIKY